MPLAAAVWASSHQQVEAFINQRREGAQPPPSAMKMGRFSCLASDRQV